MNAKVSSWRPTLDDHLILKKLVKELKIENTSVIIRLALRAYAKKVCKK